jgi:2-polyprenyl-3-methyl-5-hydroxy-6-metoxy-1,4-benzoquinol methylase
MTVETFNRTKAEAFGEKMMAHLNGAALMLMVSLGHRTRLFDILAEQPPLTSHELAEVSGLNERYIREWLGAMTTGGIVEYDPSTQKYFLPPEHAASLTRAAGPGNLGVTSQFISVLGSVEEEVLEAFSHGRGVPYSSYPRFHEVMAEESAQTVVSALLEHILPLEAALVDRLQAGIEVVDIGCGRGKALLHMAETFPNSRFLGLDLSPEAVADARADAKSRGLTNARFEICDLSQWDATEQFDLVTAFDAIHDQGHPAQVLANIRRALRAGGVFLMQDIAGSSHVHCNVGRPLSPFVYTISCMHCMSVSLAQGGVGLGAAWGQEKAEEMLREAGFSDIRVESLDHDIMNSYYLVYK